MPHTPASIEELRDHLLAGREAVYRHWSITLVEHPEDPAVKIPTYWEDQDGFHVKEEHLKHVRVDYDEPPGKVFYEGVYTVRVLSDRPQGEVSGPQDLGELMQECNSGDFVGELISELTREVTPIHMAELLLQAGSAPDFFQIDDAQSLANTLLDSASDEGCTDDLIVVSKQALNELLEGVGLGRHKFNTTDDEEA